MQYFLQRFSAVAVQEERLSIVLKIILMDDIWILSNGASFLGKGNTGCQRIGDHYLPEFFNGDSVIFQYKGKMYIEKSKTGNSCLNLDCYKYLREDRDEAFSVSYSVYYFYITDDYIVSLPEYKQAE